MWCFYSVKAAEWPPTLEQGLDIIAKVPTIIAHFYRHSQGLQPIAPDTSLSHAENYLYMIQGKKPDPTLAKALEAYLIIGADHGMNASTFTARVVTSTQPDIVSAITAAIGTLKGPLHGGAPSEVDDMLDEIGSIALPRELYSPTFGAGRTAQVGLPTYWNKPRIIA